MVKLYYAGISADLVEREKQFAREAFILGVPTAISYEIVQCGDRLGVIYEMLEAKLFSEIIRNDLQNLAFHARTLAAAARTIHSARDHKSVFPDAKTHFRRSLHQLADEFPPEDIEHLRHRLDHIPDTDECVHLDLHTSNIMIRDGQPLVKQVREFMMPNIRAEWEAAGFSSGRTRPWARTAVGRLGKPDRPAKASKIDSVIFPQSKRCGKRPGYHDLGAEWLRGPPIPAGHHPWDRRFPADRE